ncbi:uncharacterized protein LOC143228924 isoform X3 [Tachypleus tridentatus]|uniref:uncharacterized protein LOC143228924 isoform X3 n=1 Tax=Tachypleus tridentatus TaxID=6853 RepID=UPI003FD00931
MECKDYVSDRRSWSVTDVIYEIIITIFKTSSSMQHMFKELHSEAASEETSRNTFPTESLLSV